MNIDTPTLERVREGTDAEFQRRVEDARVLYRRAWDAALDDYDAGVAAHYVAHLAVDPVEAHRWNLEALRRADAVGDERVRSFYPSLYVNLGRAYELTGDMENAVSYYARAERLGLRHVPE